MEPDPRRARLPAGAGESQQPAVRRCPGCGWRNVRLSHTRTVIDSALSMFSIFPFRCRSCGIRFRRYYRKPEAN
jgi:hypothetical protein